MAKSTWAWLRDDERFKALSDEATYDEAKLAAIHAVRGFSLEQLGAHLNDLEAQKDDLERQTQKINLQITAAELVMVEQLEAKDIDYVAVGGFRFTRTPQPSVKVVDQAAFQAFVQAQWSDLLTLNASTRDATIKRLLQANEALPPGIEVNVRESIGRKKA
jgi:hypothetical protein